MTEASPHNVLGSQQGLGGKNPTDEINRLTGGVYNNANFMATTGIVTQRLNKSENQGPLNYADDISNKLDNEWMKLNGQARMFRDRDMVDAANTLDEYAQNMRIANPEYQKRLLDTVLKEVEELDSEYIEIFKNPRLQKEELLGAKKLLENKEKLLEEFIGNPEEPISGFNKNKAS